jgi:hypothetical protein
MHIMRLTLYALHINAKTNASFNEKGVQDVDNGLDNVPYNGMRIPAVLFESDSS